MTKEDVCMCLLLQMNHNLFATTDVIFYTVWIAVVYETFVCM